MTTVGWQVPADHPAFDGHFPGAPLLPGVTLLAEALEEILADPTLAARVGGTPRLAQVKFVAPVRPGAVLAIDVAAEANGVRFEVRSGARLVATGRFDAAAST